jgi:hypothetical protein
LVELIKEFIEKRKDCTYIEPQHPTKLIRPEIWDLLSKPEQAARVTVYNAELAAVKKHLDEETKVNALKYEGLNNLDRI